MKKISDSEHDKYHIDDIDYEDKEDKEEKEPSYNEPEIIQLSSNSIKENTNLAEQYENSMEDKSNTNANT